MKIYIHIVALAFAVAGVLFLAPQTAAFTVLEGSEFQVNTAFVNDQNEPVVASDSLGNFVVVWTGDDGDGVGIFAQRYNSSGFPLGIEEQINTDTVNDQNAPAVAMNSSGAYAISWTDNSGGDDGIVARLYNSSGVATTGELQVNSTFGGNQYGPSIALDSSGNGVIVWTDDSGTDGDQAGIFFQRFDNTGGAIGGETQVNTTSTDFQYDPFVAMSDAGAFVVVWTDESNVHDPSGSGIVGQLYDNTATPVGGEFLVNTTTLDNQFSSGVGMDSDGDFVVIVRESGAAIWTQPRFQRYNSAGVPQGAETLVDPNSNQMSDRDYMRIDVGPDGDFVVVWEDSDDRDGDGNGVFFRRFDSDGTPLSNEIQANTSFSGDQGAGDVAVSPNGNIVLVWTDSDGLDGDFDGVFAQRIIDLTLGLCEAPAEVGAITSTYNYFPDDACGGEMGFPGTCPGNERLGECPAGHVMTGIKYYDHDPLGPDADWIDGVGTVCTELDETGNLGEKVYDNFYPNDACGAEMGDCPDEVMGGECPTGYVVTAVRYYSNPNPGSDYTEATGFKCQELNGGGSVEISLSGSFTDNFYPDDPCGPEMGSCPTGIGGHDCLPGSAVTALQYYEYGSGIGADNVDGIGVKCSAITGGGDSCSQVGRRRGAQGFLNYAPNIYLGTQKGAQREARSLFELILRGSADRFIPNIGDQQNIFVGLPVRYFVDDEYLLSQIPVARRNMLRVLDVLTQLRRLFAFMQSEEFGYELLTRNDQTSHSAQQDFMTWEFLDVLMKSTGVAQQPFGRDFKRLLNILVDWEKGIAVNLGKACYDQETLSYIKEIDYPNSPMWFSRYKEKVRYLSTEVLQEQAGIDGDFVDWLEVGDKVIDPLKAYYQYVFGFCLRDALNL